jgi:hypothetical protein
VQNYFLHGWKQNLQAQSNGLLMQFFCRKFVKNSTKGEWIKYSPHFTAIQDYKKDNTVKYYYRLKNIQSDFPVLHDASEES